MKQLHIEFKPMRCLNVPEADEENLIFGRIHFFIKVDSKKEFQSILDVPADFKELATWLGYNRNALLNEKFPIKVSTSSSIAESITRYYEETEQPIDGPVDDQLDQTDEQLFNYRSSHGLRFGMRGVEVPNLYFGTFNGHYEVSFCGKNEKWKQEINLVAFLDEIEEIYQKVRSHK